MTAVAAPPRARALPRVRAGGAAAALVIAALAAVLLFRLSGGAWFVVETPSMGTTAPVGSLVIDEPVRFADVRVGDVLTFRPPTAPGETYTHRVVAITPRGLTTRGDINGATDGWTLGPADVVGRVAVVLPVAGWLVRALPIAIAGTLLAVFATRGVAPARRTVTRALGACLSVALAAAWLHPFAGMVLLQTAMTGRGAVATVVATGVLPIRATAPGGASVHLAPGEVGRLPIAHVTPGARIDIASALDLAWWGWTLLALACLLPLLASVLVVLRRRPARHAAR